MQDRIKEMAAIAGGVPTDDGVAFGYDELIALIQLVAEDLVAIVREHDREGYALHMLQEHIRARYGIKE